MSLLPPSSVDRNRDKKIKDIHIFEFFFFLDTRCSRTGLGGYHLFDKNKKKKRKRITNKMKLTKKKGGVGRRKIGGKPLLDEKKM